MNGIQTVLIDTINKLKCDEDKKWQNNHNFRFLMSLSVPLLNLPSAGHKSVAGEENSGAGGRTYTVDPVGNDRAGKGVECFVSADCILFMYLHLTVHVAKLLVVPLYKIATVFRFSL